MRAFIALFLFLFVAGDAAATEYRPWFGRPLVLETKADILMQAFRHVDAKGGSEKHPEFDAFFNFSASLVIPPLLTPGEIAAELEVIPAQTRKSGFSMDAIRFTARYLWLNDVVGDPLSLSTGATFSAIFPECRRNIATFDHGGIAGEAHIAIGREVACLQFWSSRLWGVGAIGIADVGSPWLRGTVGWEHNWCDRHRLELRAESIWGFGGDALRLNHFHGYGSVQYQTVDLSARYRYQFDYGIAVGMGYGYRVYARYAPENVNFILATLEIPFCLCSF